MFLCSSLTTSDLSLAVGDKLTMKVRKRLRQRYGYPPGDGSHAGFVARIAGGVKGALDGHAWGIPVVHTMPTGIGRGKAKTESAATITTAAPENSTSNNVSVSDEDDVSSSCSTGSDDSSRGGFRACDVTFGNAVFVTGSMGLAIAS